MITCPACGKENEDSAFECKRCRAPLRDEMPEERHAEPEAAAVEAAPVGEPEATADALGIVCRRCEAYNEPGVRNCTACGYQLFADALASAAPAQPQFDKTPPQAYAPSFGDQGSPQENASLSDELSALALSDQEAAEAGMSTSGNGAEPPLDTTPPQAFAPPEPEPVHEEPPARGKVAEVAAAAATAAGVVVGAAAGIASRRGPPAEPPQPPRAQKAPEPAAAPAEKRCANCGAGNPPAAKFCFDCGTPFARKAPPPEPVRSAPPPSPPPRPEPPRMAPLPKIEPLRARPEPPPSIVVEPSIHVDPELTDSTAERAPGEVEELAAPLDEPLPEEIPAGEPLAEEPLPEEATPADQPLPEEAGEPLPESVEEAPPPFQATLIVEKGASAGTAFMLGHLENSIGGSGAHVELSEDPFVAPHAATLLFAEDHLVLRDEGSANGVFVKVRESMPLEPGDFFVAGERLFRFDGPTELAKDGQGETPFLGAPRPQAAAVRVTEVLAGGRTGRTCHRAGPIIAIGRTGCDMNFPTDGVLAARHAEVRLGDDGGATLVDLGQGPSGVFIRVRAQSQHDLQAGDVLQIGEQLLRVEVS